MTYAHQAWVGKALDLSSIQVLNPLILDCLNDESMFDVTADFFIDILAHFPAFFSDGDLSSLSAFLSSPSAQRHIQNLRAGVFDMVSITYAKILLAYGEGTLQDLARNSDQLSSAQILKNLVDLLGCDANGGVGEVAGSQCIEFWSSFIEFLVESNSSNRLEVPVWMQSATAYVPDVIRVCWTKIRLPQPEAFISWDRDERDAFKELRSDVKDLLQSSYALLGLPMFNEFAHLALESLASQNWLHLESTLFSLNALSESVSDETSADEALSKLFGSSLFADIMSSANIPAMCRQTAVNLITNYTDFFERRSDYQPGMLNFLFDSLKTPAIANVAAKAIHASCWACRKELVSKLGAFLHQYEMLLTWQDIEASTKERVIGAIAAIVQAVPLEEERLDHLDNLLDFVERDVQAFLKLREEGRFEESQTHGLCSLRSLANIGKSFQMPDDVAIDLEAKIQPSDLWIEGTRLSSTQARIVGLMDIVTRSGSSDSQVMEAACQILRTGYKEIAPGPFVFRPLVTETLVASSGLTTARVDYVLDTAGALLSKHKSAQAVEVNKAALTFITHVFRLIIEMNGKLFDCKIIYVSSAFCIGSTA